MTNLKVAICTPIFPNDVQTYIVNHILDLNNNGVKTIIIARERGKTNKINSISEQSCMLDNTIWINAEPKNILKELLHIPILKISYINALKLIIKSKPWNKYGLKTFIKNLIYSKALTFKSFNILHSHSLTTSYEYLFLKEVFGIPIITTFHGMEPRGSKNLPLQKAVKVFENTDSIIVNSKYSKRLLIDMGCNANKIKIIPQGINLNYFPFIERSINKHNKIIVLTVGRLSIEKGHATAINALSKLAYELPNLEYHIVGTGPEKTRLENMAENLRLHGRVKLLGHKTGDDLLKIYASAHLFVLPSIDTRDGYLVETQGVVLQEAQSSGIPVIGSITGGIPDIITDNKTGLLYEESNSLELANKIRTLIQDPELYRRLCLDGRKDVENQFDIKKITKKIIKHYRTIL